MALVSELLEGIAAGELILFQAGEPVHRVTFDEDGRHAEAAGDFGTRCESLDEAASAEAAWRPPTGG